MKLRSTMPKLDGATTWLNGRVSREELVGKKPTFFHFWSVSCYLCKEEMEEVKNLLKRYKDDLNIVSVHMPRSKEDKDITVVKRVAAQFNIHHPIYIDNDLVLTDEFENEYVPTYYVFDQSGFLRHYQVGGSGMRMLEQRIRRILGII